VGRNLAETQRPRGAKLSRAALAALAALLLGAAPARAGDGIAVHDLDQSGVRSYWTPERMRAAEPLPTPTPSPGASGPGPSAPAGEPSLVDPHAPGSAEVAEVRSASLAAAPQTRSASVDRDEIGDPSAEPFRAHGKVFLTIRGGSAPGNYVCSGTAINSYSRSVVWTAGHCLYEADGGGYATNWMFAPGYENGATPFGEWPAKALAAPRQWRQDGSLSYDLGAATVKKNPRGQALNDVVGGRGIGFNQTRQGRTYQSFGYPARQPPLEFTGGREFRCTASLGGTDNPPGPGPSTNWIPCDMTGGSSGGGWVSAGSVLSVNSYSYCTTLVCEERLYGPYQNATAEKLYRSVAGEAEYCAGREVTHLGTSGDDRLVGTNGPDVFKTRGGNDEVIGKRGRDRVCAGGGNDLVKGNAGKDELKGQRGRDHLRGGSGRDACNGGSGRDRASGCERTRDVP
jgi:V8-like Glu-specific endopeptidase